MNKKLLLIDGSSLLSSSFFGNLPNQMKFAKTLEEKEKYFNKIMQTSTGTYTNGVYTMTKILLKIINEQKPTHVAIAWDVTRDTFRRDIYKDYKGTRSETILPLKEQFKTMQSLLGKLGFVQFMDKQYEADDYLGSLASKFEEEIQTVILTKDNDALQLVSDHTRLWLQTSKANEFLEQHNLTDFYKQANMPSGIIELTPMLVKEYKGVTPDKIVDLKAIAGDNSDNIPGIKGISEETGVRLINEYETIENLYECVHSLDKKGLTELKTFWKEQLEIKRSPLNALVKECVKDENGNVLEYFGEESAILSKKLGAIKRDIPIDVSLDELQFTLNKEVANKCFKELEFKSLILS